MPESNSRSFLKIFHRPKTMQSTFPTPEPSSVLQDIPESDEVKVIGIQNTIMYIQQNPTLLDELPITTDFPQPKESIGKLTAWFQENNIPFGGDILQENFTYKDCQEILSQRALELIAQLNVDLSPYRVHTSIPLSERIDMIPVLNALRRERQELLLQHSLESIAHEAENLFEKHFPQLGKPSEEYVLAITQGSFQLPEGLEPASMGYVGKFRDKHIIEFEIPRGMTPETIRKRLEENPLTRVWMLFHFFHEFTHQKHAEIIGQQEFFSPQKAPDQYSTEEIPLNLSPTQTTYLLSYHMNEKLSKDIGYDSLLQVSIKEGAAVCLTLVAAMAEAATLQDNDKKKMYYSFIQHQLDNKTNENVYRELHNNNTSEIAEKYINGAHIVEKLLNTIPTLKELIDFFQNVDLSKLYGIRKGSQKWNEIMENPWQALPKIAGRE